MYVTPYHFDSYLHASSQLALTTDPFALEHYLAGFSRKEHDKNNQVHEGEWAIWETDAKDYTAIELKGAGWWGQVSGNPHQGMWMATREQVMNLDMRCKDGFIHLRNPDKANWVEVRRGGRGGGREGIDELDALCHTPVPLTSFPLFPQHMPYYYRLCPSSFGAAPSR